MRLVIALGALLVCLGARAAWADNAAAAREHAQKATTFYKLAKYDDAIHEFEAAYEAKADPALLYNIAQCHRLAGHDGEALRLYQNYLRDAPRGPYRSQAEQWIETLQKSAAEHPAAPPTVTAAPPVVPETPPAPVETAPTPVMGAPSTNPAPPGPAAPPAAGTYPPGQPVGEAPAGQVAAPYVPPPQQPAASTGHRTAGIVVASIGGAFVVGGAICGLIAKSQAKKVEDEAANHDPFDPSVEKAGHNAQTAQWFGYGIGAAGLAVGVILIATAHPSAETAPANRVAVAPLAGPGLGGALMRVTF